jgi:hypothetical protein
LRYQSANRVPGYYLWEYSDGARGPLALPGNYQVRLTADGKRQTMPLEVKLDPRVNVSQADLEKQFKLQLELRDQLSGVYDAVNQIQDVREQLGAMKKRFGPATSSKSLLEAADGLEAKLVAAREPLINVKISANEDSLAYPPGLDGKLAFLAMGVDGFSDSAPTESQYQEFERLKKLSADLLAHWEQVRNTDIAAFQKLASEQGIHAIYVPDVKSERVQGGGGEER